jgi:5-methylcytosine-specific restriction protein B
MSPHFPHQLILFGPPGTSKSYIAKNVKAAALEAEGDCLVPIAFHPEFNYGEFVARLLPMTKKAKIEYTVHAGPFLRALAEAYFQLSVAAEPQAAKVVLLIDEINRGNCAEIFGDVFHLLDREDDGWSSYEIDVSDLVIGALKDLLSANGLEPEDCAKRVERLLKCKKLSLPPNLYLLGTMNTSDESIFYMDSAFKRRWNFEFCPASFTHVPDFQCDARVREDSPVTWKGFVDALNAWITRECTAPKLDDKLVGPWFIKAKALPTSPLSGSYPAELADLAELGAKVAEQYKGPGYSDDFDEALLNFTKARSAKVQARIFDYGKYMASGPRKFQAIGSFPATISKRYFYVSRKAGIPTPADTVTIEDFLDGLHKLSVDEWTHEIPRADIVGKLFLYLWDNVFDRDKVPLEKLLDVEHKALRTFGQFADQVDRFIENVLAYDAQPKA